MKRPENDNWLDEALSETIGSTKPRTDFEQWKQKHPEAVEMLTSRVKSKTSIKKHPHIIRIKIMKSPITKLAAAAVIVIAVLIGVDPFDKTSVAWAEVAKKVENCRGFICKLRETRTMKVAGKEVEIRTRAEMYGSTEYGIRQDRYQDDKLTMTVYMSLKDNEIVTVLHQMKKYGREPLEEGFADEFAKVSPQKAVSDLLSKDHKKLGSQVVNGREAEGIEVSYKNVTTRVWVAVDSQWPILYEVQKAGEDKPYLVMENFQWEVELEANLFKPNIPVDYMLLER
ncbi:MAG: hypothetical protein GY845_16185 [Planctomycetes bacterium]|nr:hypothetical protein [Planctomycetota bacterium]